MLSPIAGAARQPGGAEVQIEVLDFGVGGVARPGGWVGVRLRLTDLSPTPREILIRITSTDPDGDRPVYEETIAAPDGQGREAWLYLPLPYHTNASTALALDVFEAIATEDSIRPYEAGRLLASSVASPGTLVAPETGLIALVSQSRVRRDLGLGQYAVRDSTGDWAPAGHERLQIVGPLAPNALPDRWIGLAPFTTIVWHDADPAQLGTERPRAIREWVMRGGHLVIVLPSVGQAWLATRSNPLADLLPAVAIERHELGEEQLRRLLPLLANRDEPLNAMRPVIVHTLTPNPQAQPKAAMPILTDAAGSPIVVRRLVGQGMVTLVGIDLGATPLRAKGLPRADRFWHRILGRRGETPGAARLQELVARSAISSNRTPTWVDTDVSREIAKTGRSAAGLLLAFGLFIVYWLLAGPVGFAVLKHKGLSRHAWVSFVMIAGVFTALSWTSAMGIRPKRVDGSHLTLIDHIYEQPVQRTRTWISLLVPHYGDATLSFGDAATPAGLVSRSETMHNLIAPWQPRKAGAGVRGFPDARPYAIDARSPDRVRFPTRATVKQFVIDWAGPPLDGWRMPQPVLGEGEQGEPALTLDARSMPMGRLMHNLPAALEHVVIVVCRGQRPIAFPASIPARVQDVWVTNAIAAKLDKPWAPGSVLDLEDLASQSGAFEPLDRTLRRLVPRASNFLNASDDDEPKGRIEDRALATAFFSLLPPPSFRESGRDEPLMRRWQTHRWDLSPWLTQPCVIVIGEIIDMPTPTPLRLGRSENARSFKTSGRTFVRWVYPLPAQPPVWRSDDQQSSAPSTSSDSPTDPRGP